MIKTVNASPLTPALKGVGAAIGLSIGAILASAFFLTESKNLEVMTQVLPKIIQVVSALVGGFFAGRFSKDRQYLSGIISGLIYGAVIIIGSLIGGGFELYYAIISLLSVTAASLVGSLLGTEREKSEGARRRAMMKKMRN